MVKSFFVKLGIFLGFLFLTFLFIVFFDYLFVTIWGLNKNLSIGIPLMLSLYFWGGFFLFRKNWQKAVGIVLYTLGVLFNFVMLASPYDTQKEFTATRVFVLFGWAAGIYLIARKGWASIIFGILVILLTLPAALLGSIFMYGKLHP